LQPSLDAARLIFLDETWAITIRDTTATSTSPSNRIWSIAQFLPVGMEHTGILSIFATAFTVVPPACRGAQAEVTLQARGNFSTGSPV
jgi:hypothetical protein